MSLSNAPVTGKNTFFFPHMGVNCYVNLPYTFL